MYEARLRLRLRFTKCECPSLAVSLPSSFLILFTTLVTLFLPELHLHLRLHPYLDPLALEIDLNTAVQCGTTHTLWLGFLWTATPILVNLEAL